MERYSAIQCNKVWYSMIQYNTIQYDTTRYNPMCYSKVLFCVILIFLLHHVNGAGNTITRTQIPQLWYKTKSTKGYCTNAWGWHKLAFKTTPFVLDTLLNYKGTTVSFKRFFFFFTRVHTSSPSLDLTKQAIWRLQLRLCFLTFSDSSS